jgi:hypothetical protein
MKEYLITIPQSNDDLEIPILFLETIDDMGGLISTDGNIQQIDTLINFLYKVVGNEVTIYNSMNPQIGDLSEIVFTVYWGDGTNSLLPINVNSVSQVSKTYITNGVYDIKLKIDAPFTQREVIRTINVPYSLVFNDVFGTYGGFTIPCTDINNLEIKYTSNYTDAISGDAEIFFIAAGKSRIEEKKLYGGGYNGVTSGVTEDNISYLQYEIDGLYYRDFENNETIIFGNTGAFSKEDATIKLYTKEEVVSKLLVRDETLLGFVEKNDILSDVFVERDKISVLRNNLALSEISTMNDLEKYGNSFFKIKKQ